MLYVYVNSSTSNVTTDLLVEKSSTRAGLLKYSSMVDGFLNQNQDVFALEHVTVVAHSSACVRGRGVILIIHTHVGLALR